MLRIFILLNLFLLVGCSHIPEEVLQVSNEIQVRTSRMQESHQRLLNNSIEGRMEKVNDFFENVWVPAYISDFIERKEISNLLDDINSKENMRIFLTVVLPALVSEVVKERDSLIHPITTSGNQSIRELNMEYGIIQRLNTRLKDYLNSAIELEKRRNEWLTITDDLKNSLTDQPN